MEQHAFRDPQSAYVSVTFLFTSNTHFYGTFTFSTVFLLNQVRRLSSYRVSKCDIILQTFFFELHHEIAKTVRICH